MRLRSDRLYDVGVSQRVMAVELGSFALLSGTTLVLPMHSPGARLGESLLFAGTAPLTPAQKLRLEWDATEYRFAWNRYIPAPYPNFSSALEIRWGIAAGTWLLVLALGGSLALALHVRQRKRLANSHQ